MLWAIWKGPYGSRLDTQSFERKDREEHSSFNDHDEPNPPRHGTLRVEEL